MEYVLASFRHDHSVRTYVFEAIAAPSDRAVITVAADLNLIRKHAIPLQELPLLCRRLLESSIETRVGDSVIFTEADMIGYARERAAEAAEAAAKRRMRPVPVPSLRTAKQSLSATDTPDDSDRGH